MIGAATPARLEHGRLSTTVVRVPSAQKGKSQLDLEMCISQMRREREIPQLQYQVGRQRS